MKDQEQNQETEIFVDTQKRTMKLIATVHNQQSASILADRLDKLPYMKVSQRWYEPPIATVFCHTIKGLFTIEQFHKDLDILSDLLIVKHENLHNPAQSN
jgi:hypothetical protein